MLFRNQSNLWILYIRYNKLVNCTSSVVIRNRRKIHQGITGTKRYYQKNLTRAAKAVTSNIVDNNTDEEEQQPSSKRAKKDPQPEGVSASEQPKSLYFECL